MAARTVILHYHLFKNAGTSVDRVLKDNFPDRWVTAEFNGTNNTERVVKWITDTPEAVAFSSHTMMGPLPRIPNTRIISVMFLRNPIDRIRSAYRFEHNQQSDNFGAVLARHTDFEGYVRVRLSLGHDRQCRNFQTWRLASLVPGPEPELERAKAALKKLDVVGRVEDFDGAMEKLKDLIQDVVPNFDFTSVHANRTHPEAIRTSAPTELDQLLLEANRCDLEIMDFLGRT